MHLMRLYVRRMYLNKAVNCYCLLSLESTQAYNWSLLCRSTKLKGMSFFAFQHAFSTGVSGLEAFRKCLIYLFIYLQCRHVPLYTYMCLQVCFSYMQIPQGDSELGGSREEVQGPVVFPHLSPFHDKGWEVVVLYFVLNTDITTRYAVMLQIWALCICKFIFCAFSLYFSYYQAVAFFSYLWRVQYEHCFLENCTLLFSILFLF